MQEGDTDRLDVIVSYFQDDSTNPLIFNGEFVTLAIQLICIWISSSIQIHLVLYVFSAVSKSVHKLQN